MSSKILTAEFEINRNFEFIIILNYLYKVII